MWYSKKRLDSTCVLYVYLNAVRLLVSPVLSSRGDPIITVRAITCLKRMPED